MARLISHLSLPASPFPAHKTVLLACPAALGCLPLPHATALATLSWLTHRGRLPNVLWTFLRPFQPSLLRLEEQSHVVFFP